MFLISSSLMEENGRIGRGKEDWGRNSQTSVIFLSYIISESPPDFQSALGCRARSKEWKGKEKERKWRLNIWEHEESKSM